jgi:phenylpyruvate tautomerase PptA (4-oxalocrotonate tautomerase family)
MPLVKIDILKGKSIEYKKALLEGVHRALVESLHIPESDRFQRLSEFDVDIFEFPADRTDNVTIIEICMFPGRSKDAKKKLYQCIVKNLEENPGIRDYDIMILVKEPPMHNWGVRGGKPADEVDFDFKIDI